MPLQRAHKGQGWRGWGSLGLSAKTTGVAPGLGNFSSRFASSESPRALVLPQCLTNSNKSGKHQCGDLSSLLSKGCFQLHNAHGGWGQRLSLAWCVGRGGAGAHQGGEGNKS